MNDLGRYYFSGSVAFLALPAREQLERLEGAKECPVIDFFGLDREKAPLNYMYAICCIYVTYKNDFYELENHESASEEFEIISHKIFLMIHARSGKNWDILSLLKTSDWGEIRTCANRLLSYLDLDFMPLEICLVPSIFNADEFRTSDAASRLLE